MEQAYRSHPLVTFFVLAFAITWVVWIPRASGVPLGVLGQVWTWIPAIAALLAAALTGGRGAVRDLGARLVRWRVGWQWYAVVILGPAVFSLAVAGVYVLLGGSWAAALPPVLLGEAALVMLPVFLMILTITDGLGEELAWRGVRAPAAAPPTQRTCGQPDPRRTLGAVAPSPDLDAGSLDVSTTHLADARGHTCQLGRLYLGFSAHPRKRASGHVVAWGGQPVQRVPERDQRRRPDAPPARCGRKGVPDRRPDPGSRA